uniref:Integrase catalytic domain-containing protein n=1 Tax=Acrobeloides nanus TaxID=290746 RepID=A0A914D474_9BILA
MGTQFMSEIFLKMSRLLNIRHIHTTSYNPAANGMCERVNRDLKTMLTIFTDKYEISYGEPLGMRKFDEPVYNKLTFDDWDPESGDEKEVQDTEDNPVDKGNTQNQRIPFDPIKKNDPGSASKREKV